MNVWRYEIKRRKSKCLCNLRIQKVKVDFIKDFEKHVKL